MQFFKTLLDTWKLFVKKRKLVAASVGVDIAFLIVFGIVYSLYGFKILVHLENAMQIIGEHTGGLIPAAMSGSTSVASLSSNPEFISNMGAVFYNAFILVVLGYIIFAFFQGINWYVAYRIANKKSKKSLSFKSFMGNFVFEWLIYFAILIILSLVYVKFYLAIGLSVTSSSLPLFVLISQIVLAVWAYFAFLTLASTKKGVFKNIKNGFLAGTRYIHKTIPSVLFIVLLFFVIELILNSIMWHFYLLLLLGIVLLLPSFAFVRILLIKTINKVK